MFHSFVDDVFQYASFQYPSLIKAWNENKDSRAFVETFFFTTYKNVVNRGALSLLTKEFG